ncbi:MAG: hypothetical protein R3C62_06970 [Chloroflexota bacterium]
MLFAASAKIAADYYRARGEYAPVLAYQQRYLADLQELHGRDGHTMVAAALKEFGDLFMLNHAFAEAIEVYKQAHAIYKAQLPDPYMEIGRSARAVEDAHKARAVGNSDETNAETVEAILWYEEAEAVFAELSNHSQEHFVLLQQLAAL